MCGGHQFILHSPFSILHFQFLYIPTSNFYFILSPSCFLLQLRNTWYLASMRVGHQCILHFQFCIFNSLLLPTSNFSFILSPSCFLLQLRNTWYLASMRAGHQCILHFQFSIFNFQFLITSNFILHASSFIELTYVTNNRIIKRLLLRAFGVYCDKRV
jgi:hypothetical protein